MCMKQQLHLQWIQMQLELFIGLLWCQAKGITLPAPSIGPLTQQALHSLTAPLYSPICWAVVK